MKELNRLAYFQIFVSIFLTKFDRAPPASPSIDLKLE